MRGLIRGGFNRIITVLHSEDLSRVYMCKVGLF